jgi:acid phosphatase type 7
VSHAVLQLTVGTSTNNNSVKGGDFYLADSSTAWTEATVTWATAPGTVGSALASLGAVSLGETVTADVSSVVTGNGTYSFRAKTASGDAAAYFSRQGSATQGPQLVVTCA